MLTEKSTERKSQPQMKKKGKALLAGFFMLAGIDNHIAEFIVRYCEMKKFTVNGCDY
jgi:hypothetical protein